MAPVLQVSCLPQTRSGIFIAAIVLLSQSQEAIQGSGLLSRIGYAVECMCPKGSGWSTHYGRCMRGTTTSCEECPQQLTCATVVTTAGTGVRHFSGDCALGSGDGSDNGRCLPSDRADASTLAFPVHIDLDELDNMYIADYGNNRVRRVHHDSSFIVTIAGSGEVGFAGDGGEGPLALLRNPEAVAVRRQKVARFPDGSSRVGQYNEIGKRVVFADFQNQRIRQLTLNEDGVWIISTLIGSGNRGLNQECGPCDRTGMPKRPCAPLQLDLHNPRALAFSTGNDLYVVDSGNKRILKLPSSSANAANPGVCIFVGNCRGDECGESRTPPHVSDFEGALLSGHYEADNQRLVLNSIFKLAVDREDNLWFTDAEDNRIFFSPLNTYSYTSSAGFIGKIVDAYLNHFEIFPSEKEKSEFFILRGLIHWLRLENFTTGYIEAGEEIIVPRNLGQTYWVAAAPLSGSWCKYGDKERGKNSNICKAAAAQLARFKMIQGVCFDFANNMYITDMGQSEVIKFSKRDSTTVTVPQTVKDVYTTKGCPCMRYWVDPDYKNALPLDWPPQNCTGNPDMGVVEYNGNIVYCHTKTYCHWHSQEPAYYDPVKWCFLNFSTVGDSGTAHCNANTLSRAGLCEEIGLGHKWKKVGPPDQVAGATIMGNEMRRFVSTETDGFGFATARNFFTQDLWLTQAVDLGVRPRHIVKWSILWAWVFPEVQNNPCTVTCCGLHYQQPSYTNDEGETVERPEQRGQLWCLVRKLADLSTLDLFLDLGMTLTLVWAELDAVEIDNDSVSITECFERCSLDIRCQAVTTLCQKQGDSPCEDEQTGSLCVLFNRTYPYDVYSINRSLIQPEKLSSSNASVRDQHLHDLIHVQFQGPIRPLARFHGRAANVFVSTDPLRATEMLAGPFDNMTLQKEECFEKCLMSDDCNEVAFPGCYLLKRRGGQMSDGTDVPAGDSRGGLTAVWVKQYANQVLEGTLGLPGVYGHRGDDDNLSANPLVNRPSHCALDTKGNLVVTDTWNFRIRQISGLNFDCHYQNNLKLTEADLRSYIETINKVFDKCDAVPAFKKVQEEVLNDNNVGSGFVDNFCRHDVAQTAKGRRWYVGPVPPNAIPGPRWSRWDLPIYDLAVLCRVCKEVQYAHPTHFQTNSANNSFFPSPVCPEQAVCDCRDAMVEVLKTKTYLNCPRNGANFDKWHKWSTALVRCFMSTTTPVESSCFLENPCQRCRLRNQIRKEYNRHKLNPTLLAFETCKYTNAAGDEVSCPLNGCPVNQHITFPSETMQLGDTAFEPVLFEDVTADPVCLEAKYREELELVAPYCSCNWTVTASSCVSVPTSFEDDPRKRVPTGTNNFVYNQDRAAWWAALDSGPGSELAGGCTYGRCTWNNATLGQAGSPDFSSWYGGLDGFWDNDAR